MTLGGLCGNVMILAQMSRRFLAVLLAAAPLAVMAQDSGDGLPPGILLLSRIKRHVREELARLPDYTCLETEQRFAKPAGRSVMKPLDTLRLEVLDTGDKELYASPGAHRFQQDHPGNFTDSGLSGTGIFALNLRNLLVNDNGIFQYRGEEPMDGRRAVRYDYRVPLLQSGMFIEVNQAKGKVATKGSFWVDPDSLDLLRLVIEADEIPADLPLASSVSTIYYARTQIGDRSLMLPQTAELHLVETGGAETRNLLDYTHCRAFRAESAVRFDSAPPGAQPSAPPGAQPSATGLPATATGLPVSEAPMEDIPAGVPIALSLAAPIGDTDFVGKPIEARIAGNVVSKGKVLVPDGTVVRGRIRRLDRNPGGTFVVSVEFTEIETSEMPLRFFADLEEVDAPAQRLPATDLPGVGTFSMQGPVPGGFRMVWRSKAL